MISETDPRKKVRSNGTLSHPYFDIQPTTMLYINIFNITHIGDLVRAGESYRMPFIDRTECYNLSWWFI